MNAFLLGVIFGLSITISIGPGFMALFQTSLVRGLSAGIILASGMLLSDITLVSISYFGLSEMILGWDDRIMGVIAGLILIIMGGISLFKPGVPSLELKPAIGSQNKPALLLFKGFLLNIANPFSFIFWIGIVGFAAKNWGLHSHNVLQFFAGVFLTAFSTDLLKCYLSGLLRKVLASHAILWINKGMGVVFIGVGLFIIYKVQ
jgi:threonine/homoserine/homoserine lactone efflux protein